MILNVFSALIVSAVVCSGILIVFYSLYNGISPMPTSPKVKRQLLHVLSQNEIQGTIYELGSGWGTLAFELARRFPECRIIAYENSWVPYIYSKIYGLAVKTENLRIKQENFFNILLSRADVVVCYLSPNIMAHLQPKLESELQKGLQFRPVVGLPALRNVLVTGLRNAGLDKGQSSLPVNFLKSEGRFRVMVRRPSLIRPAPSLNDLGIRY